MLEKTASMGGKAPQMKLLASVAVVLLAVICFVVVQNSVREADARQGLARRNAAYLDCVAHAKYPDVCPVPRQ